MEKVFKKGKGKGKNTKARIMEAAAIAAYHSQTRVEKRRQDVSLHTISKAGTIAKDAFLTIVQTAKKLEINAFEYINDRVSKKFSMPALSDLIIERAKLQPG